jgi:FkbM family methyltransferase
MKNYVEIGTSDFDNLDNFLTPDNRVYFVEPVSEYLDSLKKRIGTNDSAFFDNCAISSYNGKAEITYIDPNTASEQWVRGISHLNFSSSNLIERNLKEGYLSSCKAITRNVKCFTLDYFFYRHGIRDVEYLKMDVEGHELEILCAYNWRVKPKKLKIEHKFVDLNVLLSILAEQGYTVLVHGDDVYATL